MCQDPQHFVAARVTVLVVDALHAVEIEIHDGEAAPLSLAELVPQEAHEVGALGESGDRIRAGLFERALEERWAHEDRPTLLRPRCGARREEIERGDANVHGATERLRHLGAVLDDVLEEHPCGRLFHSLHPEHPLDDLGVRRGRACGKRFDETHELRVAARSIEQVVMDELPRGFVLVLVRGLAVPSNRSQRHVRFFGQGTSPHHSR
jgi:hypothetical protein